VAVEERRRLEVEVGPGFHEALDTPCARMMVEEVQMALGQRLQCAGTRRYVQNAGIYESVAEMM